MTQSRDSSGKFISEMDAAIRRTHSRESFTINERPALNAGQEFMEAAIRGRRPTPPAKPAREMDAGIREAWRSRPRKGVRQ